MDGTDFEPIGTEATYFRGTLDGQGHKIIDLEIERPDEEYVGLFRYTGDATIIKNITFDQGWIVGRRYVGVIAGDFSGVLKNCHSSAEIRNPNDSDAMGGVGGLVGSNYRGTIINCSTFSTDGDLKSYDDDIGGIAGENTSSGTIKWCWSTYNNIALKDDAGNTVYNAGGIAGINYGIIEECYTSSGRVDTDDYYAGGIAGENTGSIINCYSQIYTDGGNYIGGLVGKNDGGAIQYSYAAGTVSSSTGGGLTGECSGSSCELCFWDTQTTGKTAGTYYGTLPTSCIGKTTAEMKRQITFTGWDFENIWMIDEGIDYPRLRGSKKCLDAPTGVVASDELAGVIIIEWNSISGAGTYRLYRADSSDGSYNPITDWLPDISSYEDITAIPGVPYFYKIKAAYTITGAGESEFSSSDDGTCTFQLPQPSNISASVNNMYYVFTQWEPVTGANYYRIYRSENETGTKTPLSEWIDGQSFVDSTGEPDVMYYYWVTAAADNMGTGESGFTGPAIGVRVSPPNPDITGEGKVDLVDYAILSSNWKNSPCTYPNWCNGADINHSGSVDIDDFLIIAEHWLEGVGNLESGLIAYYKFDELSGDVIDEMGNYNGTNNGAIRGVTGIAGNAFEFSRDQITYVDTLPAGTMPLTHTVSFWIYPTSNGSGGQVFGTVPQIQTGPHGLVVHHRENIMGLEADYYHDLGDFTSSDNCVPLDTWTYVTYTYDVATNIGKFYANGELVGSDSFDEPLTTHEDALMFGASIRTQSDWAGFSGKIDEVGIYNRALDASEIQNLFQFQNP